LHANADERLTKNVLKIDADYLFLSVVASQNWIGHEGAQDPEVPIIKVGHLLSKIAEVRSLPEVIGWLMDRRYLPVEGKDYCVVPTKISCGSWRATWYGIKPLKAAEPNWSARRSELVLGH
jgi:hypothetical protein